ncbi:MAG: ABC transporter substrate-binding protein [Anaerolineales bacterium]|jgi:ABC-type transport system substrate-binding protein
MKRKSLYMLTSVLMVMAILLAACKGAATATPTEPAAPSEPSETTTEAATEPAATEGEVPTLDAYRVAILEDITSSNIWNLWGPGASAWNYVVQSAYWPTLFAQSHKRFDYIPVVAAEFGTAAEEEGEYWVTTIPLKQGVLWSDGTEVTAEDVVYTFQVVDDFGLSGNWDYADEQLSHIEAIDPYTLKIYYNEKPGLATHQFGVAQNPFVSKAYWEPKLTEAYEALAATEGLDPESDEYVTALVEAQQVLYSVPAEDEPAFGPYVFQRWEVGAFVENASNIQHFLKGVTAEEYSDGTYREFKEGLFDFSAYGAGEGEIDLSFVYGPHAGSVVFSVYNQDAAVMALLNGDVDYIYNPSGYGPGLQAQLAGDPDVVMRANPRNGWRFMAFNLLSPPLDDVAVRQAISCMIDREFLTSNILQGAALPVYSPVPESLSFWYSEGVTRFCDGFTEHERMDWVVEHLTEAGYTWDVPPTWNEDRGGSIDWAEGMKMPNGEYVPELLLLAPSPGYDPLRATTGVLIEQWASMIGIPVRAQLTNFNNILNETLGGGGNWDLVVTGWTLGSPSIPDYMCDFFLEEYGGPFAFTGYAGQELADLCVAFKASSDLEEARQMAFRMQDILTEELPYTYLFATPVLDAFDTTSVAFPYTEVLGGIELVYGLQELVYRAAE